MRQVFELDLSGRRIIGTRHVPPVRGSRMGVLLLNAGFAARDGHGGLSAQAADALAARGIPAFRVDMPGIGDSTGPLPAGILDFFDFVATAGFAELTATVVRELCVREDLDRIVLGGLCGGAITTVFVGLQEPARVCGLLLLEPEMYVIEPKDWTAPARGQEPEPVGKRWQQLFNYWGWMRLLAREGPRSQWLPFPRRTILEFLRRQAGLPHVTNVPLVEAWRTLVQESRPTLVITAAGKMHEIFFDRINRVALRGIDTHAVRHVRLENTNHLFTTGGAIEAVLSHILPWVEGLGGVGTVSTGSGDSGPGHGTRRTTA